MVVVVDGVVDRVVGSVIVTSGILDGVVGGSVVVVLGSVGGSISVVEFIGHGVTGDSAVKKIIIYIHLLKKWSFSLDGS